MSVCVHCLLLCYLVLLTSHSSVTTPAQRLSYPSLSCLLRIVQDYFLRRLIVTAYHSVSSTIHLPTLHAFKCPAHTALSSSFPPTISVSVYESSDDNLGADPESLHLTVSSPAGIDAPGAGYVKRTSASVRGVRRARARERRCRRMLGACAILCTPAWEDRSVVL